MLIGIEQPGYITRTARPMEWDAHLILQVKDTIREQRKTYPDTAKLGQTIRHVMQQVTTETMIKQTPMFLYKKSNG